MLNNNEFEHLKELLANLSEWELISVHSYLRHSHSSKEIYLKDVFHIANEEDDFEIDVLQLIAYIEIEFQFRNLN